MTGTIDDKIKAFAADHPEATKAAEFAEKLLPELPLTSTKYKETKKEISRRAAEIDDVEDAFTDAAVPDILKEHFKRNAEASNDDLETSEKSAEFSRKTRSMENSVASNMDEDFEKLLQMKVAK